MSVNDWGPYDNRPKAMTDHKELRTLANPAFWTARDWSIFHAAASPQAVTALLDELETASKDRDRWFGSMQLYMGMCEAFSKRVAELEALATPHTAATPEPEPSEEQVASEDMERAWFENEEELRKRIEESRPEMQALIEEDLKPGGLFDQVFAKKPTPADSVQVRTPERVEANSMKPYATKIGGKQL